VQTLSEPVIAGIRDVVGPGKLEKLADDNPANEILMKHRNTNSCKILCMAGISLKMWVGGVNFSMEKYFLNVVGAVFSTWVLIN
jgi:hypothetical protein